MKVRIGHETSQMHKLNANNISRIYCSLNFKQCQEQAVRCHPLRSRPEVSGPSVCIVQSEEKKKRHPLNVVTDQEPLDLSRETGVTGEESPSSERLQPAVRKTRREDPGMECRRLLQLEEARMEEERAERAQQHQFRQLMGDSLRAIITSLNELVELTRSSRGVHSSSPPRHGPHDLPGFVSNS